jgi:L-amino acid N-acyltransferase YncA
MELRLARREDGEGLRAIYAPIVLDTAISFETIPPTAQEMGTRVDKTVPSFPWLVASDGRIAGYAYAGPYATRDAYRWSASVSVYLREDARGSGLGRRLYTALFSLLEAQGFREMLAGISLPNQASVGLHESMGFKSVGIYRSVGWKLGAWHDVGHWQKPLARRDSAPSDPLTLTDIDPSVFAAVTTKFSL